MRRKATPDFWRAAWARHVAAMGDGEDAHHQAFDLVSFIWLGAIEQARAGDWAWLDELVERVTGDGGDCGFAPPPDTWAVLDEFFSHPPKRTKGLKRRVDQTVANAIRYEFAHLTTQRGVVEDEAGNTVGFAPPMTDVAAREFIARECALSPETVRDIVERRNTYLGDR